MTGGGPARGTRGDDDRRSSAGGTRRDTWRGVRGESRGTPAPRPGAFGDSWTGRAELEELPAQPVMPRGSARLGIGGTLAVVAIVALLAVGFGVLGGRPDNPEPTPRPSRPKATPVVAALPTPLVTPWVDCAAPPTAPPEVLLEVNGRPTSGNVEVISWSAGPPPAEPTVPGPTAIPTGATPARVDVPIDVISELWIRGGSCAIAWNIDLVDGDVLHSVSNPSADPGYAAQNRFALSLIPYEGGDYELRVVLVFETLVARATWPIHVLPFARPVAVLDWDGADVPMIEGCDLGLFLGSREPLDLNACPEDLSAAPGAPVVVRSDERGVFAIPGWLLDVGEMTCGHLSGLSFVAQPQAGCSLAAELVDGKATFDAPAGAGTWTLGISACGTELVAVSPLPMNRVCGTWYAEVEFRV